MNLNRFFFGDGRAGADTSLAMAKECLRREKPSTFLAAGGLFIVVMTHRGAVPADRLLMWSLVTAAVIAARVALARISLARAASAADPVSLVNRQALMMFLNAACWGSMMALFHSGANDHLHYVRLIILSAGLSFTAGTLGVYLRCYLSFALGILLPSNAFLLWHGPAAEAAELVAAGYVYTGALVFLAAGNRNRLKAAIEAEIERERATSELERANAELNEALKKIDALEGFLPICASCKNIRDADGEWHPIEEYIQKRSKAAFTHGICENCAEKLYPDVYRKLKDEKRL